MFRAWNREDRSVQQSERARVKGVYCSYGECRAEWGIPGGQPA